MTKAELIIIIIAILIPFVVLVMFLLKNQKDKKNQTKTEQSSIEKPQKPAEPKPESSALVEEELSSVNEQQTDFNTEDFKGYLREKANNMPKPVTKENTSDNFNELSDEMFETFKSNKPKEKKEEPIDVATQIQELSPEIKALIIAGILDKKDY